MAVKVISRDCSPTSDLVKAVPDGKYFDQAGNLVDSFSDDHDIQLFQLISSQDLAGRLSSEYPSGLFT